MTGRPSDVEQSARTGDGHRQAADRSRNRRSASVASGPAPQRAGAGSRPRGRDDQEASKVAELTADLQRVQADFANYRKRALRDQQAAADRAKAAVVSQLLGVLDDLERARKHGDLEAGPLKSVADKLVTALGGLGLSAFGAEGDDFDPVLHEAVQHEGDGARSPVIGTVMRRGYRLGDRCCGTPWSASSTPCPATERPSRSTRPSDPEQRRTGHRIRQRGRTTREVEEVTRHGPA